MGNPILSFNLLSEIKDLKEYEPIINFYLLKTSNELMLPTSDYIATLNRAKHHLKEQQFFIGKFFFGTNQLKKAESIFLSKIFFKLVEQKKEYPSEDFFLPIGIYNSLIHYKSQNQPELQKVIFAQYLNEPDNLENYLSSKSEIVIKYSRDNDKIEIDINDALNQIINYCIYDELLETIITDDNFPVNISQEKRPIYRSNIEIEIQKSIAQSYIDKRLKQLRNRLFKFYERQLKSNIDHLTNSFENVKKYEELINSHKLALREYFEKLVEFKDKSKLESYFGLVIFEKKLFKEECEIILQYLILKEKIGIEQSFLLFMYIFYIFSYKNNNEIVDEAITEGLQDFVKVTWELFNIISGPIVAFLSGGIAALIKRYLPKVNQGLKYRPFKKEYLKIINMEIESIGWERFSAKYKIHNIEEISQFLK